MGGGAGCGAWRLVLLLAWRPLQLRHRTHLAAVAPSGPAAAGEAFFRKWGTFGVFVGRFFGPLRSIMPLVAGICGMRQVPFQIANLASAVLWATGVLTPGIVAIEWLL